MTLPFIWKTRKHLMMFCTVTSVQLLPDCEVDGIERVGVLLVRQVSGLTIQAMQPERLNQGSQQQFHAGNACPLIKYVLAASSV